METKTDKDPNQVSVEEFVQRIIKHDVFVNQSYLVEHLLNSSGVCMDDVENYYPTFIDESTGGTCEICHSEDVDLNAEGVCEECFDSQREPQEIFEWWAVSDWLKGQLIQEDAPILDCDFGTWWGRTETGQCLTMDWHLKQIARRVLGVKDGDSDE